MSALETRSATLAEQTFTRRALLLGAGVGGVGLVLAGRMAQLAIREGSKYDLLAEDNRVALRLIAPRRGWIVDRGGRPLALNRPDYRLELVPDRVPDLEWTLARLAPVLALAPADLARVRAEAASKPGYLPISVASGIPWDRFARLNLMLPELPGIVPVRGFSRLYPGGAAYGHLLGYMAAPSAEEYTETKNRLLLLPGFKVGKDGMERTLEDRLRGAPGARREEVAASGRPVRELESTPDTPGRTVRLTIDRDLQDYAAARVGPESASVVVMDCWTGDVLCMVSAPSFDPNAFSDGISHAEWGAMQGDERLPLINKSTSSVYPPGSTFKMATAIAVLGRGFTADAGISCGGGYRFGGHYFRCHLARGHGGVNLRSALPASCNTYFYHYGRLAGIEAIAASARALGLGAKYELPLASQRSGSVPDDAWKRERFDQAWLPGDTLSAAIGQGYVSANPLQLAVMSARIASGRAVVPRLLAEGPSPAFAALAFPVEHLDIVRQGMADVVNGNRGTARRARLPTGDFLMAGKTGTAQAVGRDRRPAGREAGWPWKYRNHAWFVAFAPVGAPRYAMSVLIVHGGAGSAAAAPIARDVMTYLFAPGTALAELAKIEEERTRVARARIASVESAARRSIRLGVDASRGILAPPAPPPPPTPVELAVPAA